MHATESPPSPANGVRASVPTYTIGTLTYTKAGLISLCGWLLWGDFILTFMEAVMPALLPILLKDHGATNREIAVIATTLGMVMNSLLNPVISYQSDRFRSRWGRRRPFIFVTTPFVVLFLIAVPFAPEILVAVRSLGFIDHLLSQSPIAPIILMFGLLVAGFQLPNMFIATIYYYLIPDVVPSGFIGRFMGLFRIFGAAAAMVFNYFVFGLAQNYMRPIFVLTALVYGFFILLMCWRVKEGEYPAPASEPRAHWWSGIKTYFQECFGIPYYWWVFLVSAGYGWGFAGSAFNVFFYREELGFSLDLFGKVIAMSSGLAIFLSYPYGILADRWGSHKCLMLGFSGVLLTSLLMYFFAVNTVTGIIFHLTRSVFFALCGLVMGKWTIEIYPKERYGQFGSAGALFGSIGGIIATYAFASLVDYVKVYRILLLWNAAFAALALYAAVIVRRQWKALGGPDHYLAP